MKINFKEIVLLTFSITTPAFGLETSPSVAPEECGQLEAFFSNYNLNIPKCCSEEFKCENNHVTEMTLRIHDPIDIDFSSFPKLPNLKYLALDGPIFKDSVLPSALFELPQLDTLHVMQSNIVSLNIPNTCNLKLLSVYRGNLNSFPEEVKNCKNLETLDLSYNNIQSLPDDISDFKNLKELLLINSQLTSLPDSIFDLKLKKLHLNLNQNLKTEIYKFATTIDECSLDRSITCYEPGTCTRIVDDPETSNPKVINESDFEKCLPKKKFRKKWFSCYIWWSAYSFNFINYRLLLHETM